VHNQIIPVIITAKDASNNTAVCILNLKAVDVTLPSITTCPPSRNVYPNATCEIEIPDLSLELLATDCTLPLTVTQSPTAGTLILSGVGLQHIVTMTVMDGAGNSKSCNVSLFTGRRYFAYITNYGDNTVSVINTGTNKVEAIIPVGQYPFGVSASRDGKRVYVTNSDDDNVSVINTSTNQVIAYVPTGGNIPYGVCVNNNGNRAYTVHGGSFNVSVINTTTNMLIGTIGSPLAYGIAVNPSGSRVYVCDGNNSNIIVINTLTNLIVATIPLGSLTGPLGICVSQNGSRIYVSNVNSSISVINAASNTLINTISVPGFHYGICVSPNGSRLYVTGYNGNTVSVINTSNYNIVNTISVGADPLGISITPDGKWVYVANQGDNTVSVINTAANLVDATVPVGSAPYALGNFIGGPSCPSNPEPNEGPSNDPVEVFEPEETLPVSLEMTAAPNPFTNQLELAFGLGADKQVEAVLIDMGGKTVLSEEAQMFSPGQHQFRWNTESLPQGAYIIGLKVEGKAWEYRKVMLIR